MQWQVADAEDDDGEGDDVVDESGKEILQVELIKRKDREGRPHMTGNKEIDR